MESTASILYNEIVSFSKPYVILWKTDQGLSVYYGLMNHLEYQGLVEKSMDMGIFIVQVDTNTVDQRELLRLMGKHYGLTFPIDHPDSSRNKYVLAWREMKNIPHGESDQVFAYQVSLTDRELHGVADALLGTRHITDVVAVPHDEPPMSEEDLHEAIRQEYGVTYEAKLGPKDWIPKWSRHGGGRQI